MNTVLANDADIVMVARSKTDGAMLKCVIGGRKPGCSPKLVSSCARACAMRYLSNRITDEDCSFIHRICLCGIELLPS